MVQAGKGRTMDAKLVMFREDGERREFALNAERTVIGRKNDCDVRIPLSEVSRRHVELRIEKNRIVARDMGSANGTYVNNKKVSEVELSAGDHIIIGPVVFTVQIDGQPSEIRPVKTRVKRQTSSSSAVPIAASVGGSSSPIDDELDPISALEALASSADQTAIDPLEDADL